MAGSDALLASQINGGGCLAPPTPNIKSTNVLGDTLEAYFGKDTLTNYEKYSGQVSQSLAWRTSSSISNVVGMGAYIDPTKTTVPRNPAEMGMIMRNGRRERVNRARKMGDPLVFETTQQRSNAAIESLSNAPKHI